MLLAIFYFIFVQFTLLIPGYALLKKYKWLEKHPGIQLSLAYVITLSLFGFLATIDYAFGLNPLIARSLLWLVILFSLIYTVYRRFYLNLAALKFPLLCTVLMAVFSLSFISLSFNARRTIVPDPQPEANRNYSVFDVKVLNAAHTQANDNYVPYRQAQFFSNRSDPAHDSFISEWGVSFFERTPLMGAVTASYFNLLNDKPPVDYIWSQKASDPDHTFMKFQVLAQTLNALLLLPGFFLLEKLFGRETARVSLLFLIPSVYLLYNSFFTWPKSLVAFFILTSWLLLLEKKYAYTLLAGLISGVAYLTHDLAILYIGASFVFLLINRRFRELIIFTVPAFALSLPWLLTSALVYHKHSNFLYYPVSTEGIPQSSQYKEIVHRFFHTSPLRLLWIRIDSIFYLISPYQLLTSEGGQSPLNRLWSLGLYSIPGALGLGLIFPVYAALIKLRKTQLWILILIPIILCALVIGWPRGLGALHFAEAIVIILTGISINFLIKLGRPWLIGAFVINFLQFIIFTYITFDHFVGHWFANLKDLLVLASLAAIITFCAITLIKLPNYQIKSRG